MSGIRKSRLRTTSTKKVKVLRLLGERMEVESPTELFRGVSNADFITAKEGTQGETEELNDTVNNSVKTLPLNILMPVLVTGLASDKLLHRSSLLSFMLRQPLHPGTQRRDTPLGPQLWKERRIKNVLNPDSPLNRVLLKDSYGVELPPMMLERLPGNIPNKPVTGSLLEHLSMPPKANRVDPQLALPPVPKKDAERGVYSLLERRWIHPTSVSLRPSPVVVKHPVTLHEFYDKFALPSIEWKPAYPGVLEEKKKKKEGDVTDVPHLVLPQITKASANSPLVRRGIVNRLHSFNRKKAHMSEKKRSKKASTVETMSEPEMGIIDFRIEDGVVCETQPEFLDFKLHHLLQWKRIKLILDYVKDFLINYDVPVAIMLGARLAEVAETCWEEDKRQPTQEELYSFMENREEVKDIVPRRMGPKADTEKMAAILIQTTWRGYSARAAYRQYQTLKSCVGVIEGVWIRHSTRMRLRCYIQETYRQQLGRFRERAKMFAESWDQIQRGKHVVIHVPSLGYRKELRNMVTHFGVRQNTQMARLCEISDPQVDVLYVCPVPLTTDTVQYYSHLLGLAGAVSTGRLEDQQDLAHRFKIIVPEAANTLPSRRLPLASLLKYSPRTMRRLSSLIRGRKAYLVSGHIHKDDVSVADMLDVPVLGPEPEVAALLSSKSGARGVFEAAGVCVAPGTSIEGACTVDQLYESVTQLVLDNPLIVTWLFKIDDEFDGRGIARCDVSSHLTCFTWLQSEATRYGDNWKHKWAQESAFRKVLDEIPVILENNATPSDTYQNWKLYLMEFATQGGVIEAYPPADSLTPVTTCLLLQPNREWRLLMTGDLLHAQCPLRRWGMSVPQTSLQPMIINNICTRVARVCRARNVIGYVSLDLVTFVDPLTLNHVVWALDLHLGYSDTLALFRLANYITHAQFHPRGHSYTVVAREAETSQLSLRNTKELEVTSRFCVMTSQLLHSNLGFLQYPVFFQLCRANGIGFDLKEREGTVFTLIDNIHREQMGMITLGSTLQGTLATFARHLQTLHEEISTPNMQGITNFPEAIQNIESILDSIMENVEHYYSSERQEQELSRQESKTTTSTLAVPLCPHNSQ